MTIGFSQKEIHHMCTTTVDAFYNGVADGILRNTDLEYAFTQTEEGCFLKPTFRNMPYRNSFVPEIDVAISQENGQTVLHMEGRPTGFVRTFMRLWCISLAIFEVVMLVIAVMQGVDHIILTFVPLIMCVFGYLLCKIATRASFRSVVNAIRKEFL